MNGLEVGVDFVDHTSAELNFQHEPLDIFVAPVFFQNERSSFS
jgi:hypothetical protein